VDGRVEGIRAAETCLLFGIIVWALEQTQMYPFRLWAYISCMDPGDVTSIHLFAHFQADTRDEEIFLMITVENALALL